MSRKCIAALVTAVAAMATAPVVAAGQAPDGWTAPRTADDRPDLGGVWASDSATPFQRPEALGDRTTLTDDEVAAMAARAVELFDGGGDAVFGDTPFLRTLAALEADEPTENQPAAAPARPAVDRQLQPVLDDRPLV